MPLSVTCPGCESVYPVGESLAGKTIRCKKCSEMMTVPTPSAAVKAKPVRAAVVDDDEDDAPRKKPVRAKAAVADDEDDDAPRKAIRPARAVAGDEDDEEDDEAPRKGGKNKGVPVGLIVGGVIGLLVLVGGGGAAAYFGFVKDKDTAQNTSTTTNPNPAIGGQSGGPQQSTPTQNNGGATATTPAATKPQPKADPVKPRDEANTTAKASPNASQGATQRQSDPPSGFGLSNREYMLGKMDRITLDKVKKAAVLIRVETEAFSGEGSGWFGEEPGFVFTNAHVIGMKSPGSKEPKKLTLFLNPGTPEQREISHQRLKILAVDREIDLALVQVIGEKDLPVPLKVKPSLDLIEGQGLSTVGFPFGSQLSSIGRDRKPPEVSIRPSTFTAFRRDPFGQPRRIQVEGGIYTGNSGGAIVDAEGTVCGVVVEVWRDSLSGGQSQIGLGVPTEYVLGLLAGRIGEIEYKTPYKESGKVHIPVKMICQDPIGRLNKVGMAGWVGDVSDKYRKPGIEKPAPEASDADYMVQEFKIEKTDKKFATATGELVLPELPPGRAYWVQPYYSNSSTPQYWMPGIRLPVKGPPVERIPADLHAKFRPGTKRSVTMSNDSDLNEYLEGEGESKEERTTIATTLKVTETVHQGDTSSAARLRLTFEEIGLKRVGLGGAVEQEAPKRLMALLNQFAKLSEAWAYYNNRGQLYKYTVDVRNIRDPIGHALVQVFASDAIDALQVCSIPLPNATVNAGEKWEAVANVRLSVGIPRVGKNGQIEVKPREYKYSDKVTYTYIGQRERAGKKEAVIVIEGKISQAPGAKETASGSLKGLALIDLDSGMVVDADLESEFELDTSGEGMKKKLSGINKYKLTRGGSAQ